MAATPSSSSWSMSTSLSHLDMTEPEAFPSMQATSLERRPGSSSTKIDQPRRPVTRSKKAVAAVTGAVFTSLLMTPFDVIKTRLQTQTSAEPLFFPSQHISTIPNATIEQGKKTLAKVGGSSKLAFGGISAHPATCCQQTYFTTNKQPESLLCRYDPRQAEASGSNSRMSSRSIPRPTPTLFGHATSFSPSSTPRSSVRILPSPPPAPNSYLHPYPSAVVANGSSSCACAFPNETIAKQQLKASPANQSRLTGLWDGVIKVGRAEGVRGLWRGLAPTLMMTVPSQVTYMSCYDYFRSSLLASEDTSQIQAQFQAGSASGITGKTPSLSAVTAHSLYASLLAGAMARGISATLVTPFELVRTRLQASSRSQANLSSILRGLWVEMRTTSIRSGGGPLILWRGLTPTLWRDVPFSAIYFAGYEAGKRSLTGGGLGEGNASGSGEEFGVAFISGAVSGSIAAVFTHPFDVVKTQLQTKTSSPSSTAVQERLSRSLRGLPAASSGSVWSTLHQIIEREGYKGLWKGLSPRTAKVAPACGVMIASFEVVGRFLADLDI